MKKIVKYICLFLLCLILFPTKADAAKVTCATLKTSQTYHFNLDKSGDSESVKVSISKKKSGYSSDYTVNVKINGKSAVKRNSKGHYVNPFMVMVTDTNTTDKQLELFVVEESAYDSIAHIYYYQYVDGKAVFKQDLAELYKGYIPEYDSDIHRIKKETPMMVNGKGEIYIKGCMRVENFDYQHVKLKLKLKNGVFACDTSKTYKTLDEESLLWFSKPKKTIKAYTKRGGNKKAFDITKKSKDVRILAIYYDPMNGETFLKVKNGNGKNGWVDVKKASTEFWGTYHVG